MWFFSFIEQQRKKTVTHRNYRGQFTALSVGQNKYITTYIDCIWFAEPSQSFATSHNRLIKSISVADWLHFSLCPDKVECKCQKLKLSNLKAMQCSSGLISSVPLNTNQCIMFQTSFIRLVLICH